MVLMIERVCTVVMCQFQFATAQEELMRLLNDYIKILDNKVLTYAVEIKVQLYTHTHDALIDQYHD